MKVEVAVLSGLPVPNGPYGLCGPTATLNSVNIHVALRPLKPEG